MRLMPEDIRTIQYFWEEKGDLERWSSWEDALPEIRSDYPELVSAWDSYKTAIKTLDRIVRDIAQEQPE